MDFLHTPFRQAIPVRGVELDTNLLTDYRYHHYPGNRIVWRPARSLRIVGLDIGSKRIGIAVSDELGITAQGLKTLDCSTLEKDLAYILALVRDYQAQEIVVGVPYNMDGSEGTQAKKVRDLMERMAELTEVPVRPWDERLSTVAAERTLLEANMSRARRRKVVDKLAAVIILQNYLDMKRFNSES
ncbi:MAG: putative pre6S rRNA nuclease [Thermodesulfobacteriota bacterium]|nr:putative pre6S rRNA nuclease [Thermodesulfobacteriota bacterium]